MSKYFSVAAILLFVNLNTSFSELKAASAEPSKSFYPDSYVETKKSPIEVTVPNLNNLPAESQNAVKALIVALTSNISNITGLAIRVPESFLKDPNLSLDTVVLSVPNVEEELRKLSGTRLNNEQFASVKESATYAVFSPSAPDQPHLWRINPLLQLGTQNIQIEIREDLVSGISHLTVRLPRVLFGKENLSASRSFKIVWDQFVRMIDLTFGVARWEQELTETEIQAQLGFKYSEFLIEEIDKLSAQFPRAAYDTRLLAVDSKGSQRVEILRTLVAAVQDRAKALYEKEVEVLEKTETKKAADQFSSYTVFIKALVTYNPNDNVFELKGFPEPYQTEVQRLVNERWLNYLVQKGLLGEGRTVPQIEGDETKFAEAWLKEQNKAGYLVTVHGILSNLVTETTPKEIADQIVSQFDSRVNLKLAQIYTQEFLIPELARSEKTFSDAGFENIIPLLKQNILVQQILEEEESKYNEAVEQGVFAALQRWSAKHPLLAQVDGRLEKEENRIRQEAAKEAQETILSKIFNRLQTTPGITNPDFEYEILKASGRFYQEVAPQFTSDLRKKKTAEVVASFAILKSWDRNKWVEKNVQPDGSVQYASSPFLNELVKSDYSLWRLERFLVDWKRYAINGTYHYLMKSFYLGPLGLRALFGKEAFSSNPRLNSETGQWTDGKVTQTLTSSTRNIWKKAHANHQEQLSRRGGIFRNLGNAFSFAWNYGVLGIGGTSLVATYKAAGFIVTTVYSALGTVGVALPIMPTFNAAFNAYLYNGAEEVDSIEPVYSRNEPKRRRSLRLVPPLVTSAKALGYTAVGLLQVIRGVVYEGIIAPASNILHVGWLRYGRRGAFETLGWDPLVRGVMRGLKSTTQDGNSFAVRRVAGPGISSEYLVQTTPEVAVLGMRIKLQALMASRISDEAHKTWIAPYEAAQSKFEDITKTIGIGVPALPPMIENALTGVSPAEKSKLIEAFLQPTAKLEERLNKLTANTRQKIVLSTKDLDLTIRAGAAMAEAILGKTSDSQLWKSLNLEQNDFVGLSKHLLANALGDDILSPAEAWDKSILVPQGPNSLLGRLSEIVQGADPDAFSLPVVSRSVQKNPIKAKPVITSGQACAVGLTYLGRNFGLPE